MESPGKDKASKLFVLLWGTAGQVLYNTGMIEIPIVLFGYGQVGSAFHRLLYQKSGDIRDRYGLSLRVTAVLRERTACFQDEGLAPMEHEGPGWLPRPPLSEALDAPSPGAVVVCTASSGRTGEPGLGIFREALNRGWHIITADKGPLIAAWPELRTGADFLGKKLKISGATAAALPTLDVALGSLAGTRILSFEGILNGTSNYILTRMGEGLDFAAALAEAQSRGIAEPDPSLDVEGWDTAYKVLLLTNSILNGGFTLQDIEVQGIRDIPASLHSQARLPEKKLKLVGRMLWTADSVQMSVKPTVLNSSFPLFAVDGTEKGITFETDSMGRITLTGGKSDPRGAAAALLKDVITIYADLP
jgi:homoserine dehydrogenase